MKDCTTCKYGYEDERLGIQLCHHPKRFSEDCVDFNMHEEKEIKESEKPMSPSGSSEIPNDLEEAAKKTYPMTITPPTPVEVAAYYNAAQQKLRDAFKAGAKWMAEHLKKKERL